MQNGTGWATAIAVSAVLEQVGVSADSGTVLMLADQGYDTHHHVGCAEEQFPDSAETAVAPPETRLVHWPSIIDCLENGLNGQVDTRGTILGERKKRQLRSSSPETTNQPKTPRLDGERAKPIRADNEEPMPRAAETKDDIVNPETTSESDFGSDDGFVHEGGLRGRQREINDSCNGIMLVKQGLSKIDAGLRELGFDGAELSPSQIADTINSLRETLEVKAGVHCGREGSCRATQNKIHPQDKEMWLGNPEGNMKGCGVSAKSPESTQGLDAERLVQKACMAGKRGDVAALKVRL